MPFMVSLTALFLVCLVAAHRQEGGMAALSIELSRFRDGDARLTGYVLFGLLLAIGSVLLRELDRQRRIGEFVVIGVAMVMLRCRHFATIGSRLFHCSRSS